MRTVKCKNCNNEFKTSYPTAEYCSRKCRNTYKIRERRRRHGMVPREVKSSAPINRCEVCEVEISRRRKYCHGCSKEIRKEQQRAYRVNNPTDRRENRREWEKRNPEKVTHNRARQANRRRGLPSTLTVDDWKLALAYFDNKCAYCGEPLEKAHREHFFPAKLGGGYTKENIVPSCPKCNLSKNGKNPLDWLVKQTRGLVAYVKVIQYLEGV